MLHMLMLSLQKTDIRGGKSYMLQHYKGRHYIISIKEGTKGNELKMYGEGFQLRNRKDDNPHLECH